MVREGTNSYFNWEYGPNGQPVANNFTLLWGFFEPGQASAASEQFAVKTFVGSLALPSKIFKFNYDASWTVSDVEQPFSGPTFDTGSNLAYVTWGPPLGEIVTRKRIHWAVTAADGATTEELAADGIYEDLGSRLNKSTEAECDEGQEWALLDSGIVGDCDDWARLMNRSMKLLGIPAVDYSIKASTNANVRDLQRDYQDPETGQLCYLIMDFEQNTTVINPPNQGSYNWNAWEGVCETADHVYALFPPLKGVSDRDIFNQLPFTQFYVLTNGTPGVGYDWGVSKVVLFVQKPILTP